jgi:sugar phosphate permease
MTERILQARPLTTRWGKITAYERSLRKVYLRLLPFAVFSYVLAYIDRINVSFAVLTMRGDLGMSAGTSGFAVGMGDLPACGGSAAAGDE